MTPSTWNPALQLQRRGITKDLLVVGAEVNVEGFKAKDGSNNGFGQRVTVLAEFADAFGPLLTRTLRARKPKYEAEFMNRLLTAAVAIFGSEQHTMDVLRRTRFFSKTSKPQRRYGQRFGRLHCFWCLIVACLRVCVLCVHCVAVQSSEYGGASAVSGSAAGSVSSHSGHSFLH